MKYLATFPVRAAAEPRIPGAAAEPRIPGASAGTTG